MMITESELELQTKEKQSLTPTKGLSTQTADTLTSDI